MTKYILPTLIILGLAGVAYAAPTLIYQRTILPEADSTYDLGSNTVRWANIYGDTIYGDGSNLTGITGAGITNLNNETLGSIGDVSTTTIAYGSTLTYDTTNWVSTSTIYGFAEAWKTEYNATTTLNGFTPHNAVTLAGQDYLTLSTQQITAGEIEPDDLASSDFGEFTCNGTTCVLEATNTTLTTTSNLTTVGALNAGSITSGFTSIDVGAGTIDGGVITADTNFAGDLTGAVTGAASGNLLNSESDTLIGTLTADGLTLGSTEIITIGTNLFTHDGTDFTLDDTLEVTGYTTSTLGLNTQGTLHIGGNSTFDGTGHDSFSDFVANEHLDWTGSVGTIHADNYTNNTYTGGTNITLNGSAFDLDDISGTYSVIAGNAALVTVGALDSGSITNGFGNIETGGYASSTTGLFTQGNIHAGGVSSFDGNVGIGTTTPLARISVQGGGSDILRLADSSGTEKVTVLNNGNVGIGTTEPGYKFVVKNTGSNVAVFESTAFPVVRINNDESTGESGIRFRSSDNAHSDIVWQGTGSSETGSLTFRVPYTTPVMTLKSGGNVGIGDTTPSYKLEVSTDSAGKPGAGGLWTVVSDERIKQNITDLSSALDKINALRPVSFEFIEDYRDITKLEDTIYNGFIAQEYETVFPDAVNTTTDLEKIITPEVKDKDGNITEAVKEVFVENPKDMNTGDLQAYIVKAIQELDDKIVEPKLGCTDDGRIAELEKRIEELENRMGIIERFINWFRNIW